VGVVGGLGGRGGGGGGGGGGVGWTSLVEPRGTGLSGGGGGGKPKPRKRIENQDVENRGPEKGLPQGNEKYNSLKKNLSALINFTEGSHSSGAVGGKGEKK